MRVIISVFFIISILLQGCASMFSPYSQEIRIISGNPKAELTIDSVKIGNDSEQIVVFEKDLKVKQLIFHADSFKTQYRTMLQNSKSGLYYINFFPAFIFIYFATAIYDNGTNVWCYDDSFTLDYSLRKFPYWDKGSKRILCKAVSFDIGKNQNYLQWYEYDNYIDKNEPNNILMLDTIKLNNSRLSDVLEKTLVKTNFTDTINTVFMDNINTLILKCKITKMELNKVYKRYPMLSDPLIFAEIKMNNDWLLEDIYGDTLITEKIESKSGQFSHSLYPNEQAVDMAINDALIESYLDFMSLPKVQDILKFDTTTYVKFDRIKLGRPEKIPNSLESAMKASVTVKSPNGHGSGFLISHDGYIITNHHVVNKDVEYKVIMNDGEEYTAKVIRNNKLIDLALIKIEGKFDYAFLLPQEQNFIVGQNILAIGTPKTIELGQSVSKGIVSNVRKNMNRNYIQTDVSVNSGNSGGAVVNEAGELIGVVEYKLFGVGLEGISFSIPAYDVQKALDIEY